MTELNGGPIPSPKAVLLNSRQLTITLSPVHHTLLSDLVKVTQMSVHDTASDLLHQAIEMAHMDLKRQKFVWLLAHWIVWGS